MAKGFTVQSVEIEGFKGFTTRQRIDFGGRHIFLLGQNGNGKSSIIEAVRWGLFGSARRPNEIVANQGYGGRCRVDITLVSEGAKWRLRRTLNRGTSGGSDAVLTDAQGTERLMQEIMPQLDSVDAGEGMHIIFAPQSTPLRRQPEDLTAFERTVFNHLDLTHPRALLGHLDDIKDGQELKENELGEECTGVRDAINRQIDYLERQRGNITSSPPWDGDRPPTVVQSEQKARNLITKITGEQPDELLNGLSLDALIDSAEESLIERRDRDQTELENELFQVDNRKEQFEELLSYLQRIEELRLDEQRAVDGLAATLGGVPIDDLRKSAAETRRKAGALALRREIADKVAELLEFEQEEEIDCPVCAVSHTKYALESALHVAFKQSPESISQDLVQLESRIQRADALEEKLRNILIDLSSLQEKVNESRKQTSADDATELLETADSATLTAIINRYADRSSSIGQQIDNQDSWFGEKQSQLRKLEEEDKYHRIQKDLRELHQARNRFGRTEETYGDLVSFGESVRTIYQAVSDAIKERLEEDLPEVSNNLSEVFAALTSHPYYDRLAIPHALLPKLELRVSSSKEPGAEYRTGVLNGQAESALDLVPYFAFSQTEDAPTEVYLVLLDDPTRAFDEDHTRILIEGLARLGQNVQIMVASHETSRFRDLVPQNFDSGSYVIVEPVNWSHDDGPELRIAT